VPNTNLISNIGFGEEATHTKDPKSWLANHPANGLKFPIIHPPSVAWDAAADDYTNNQMRKFHQKKRSRKSFRRFFQFFSGKFKSVLDQ
jgi:hypothetical protein